MHPPLARLTIYTKKMDEMVAFYTRHFGYVVHRDPEDRIVLLEPPGAGVTLQLHPAARSQKMGQVLVKLVFDVADVDGFCAAAAEAGLVFGKPFQADGYTFANAKDPSGNSICVSSRAFRGRP